jgi:plastocyanin
MMTAYRAVGTAAFLLLAGAARPAWAEDPEVFDVVIQGHRFEPAELQVPAGARFTLRVKNADDTPEEFESTPLNVERVIGAGRTAMVKLGPLAPGNYDFVGEFHGDTARGSLTARAIE